MKRTSLAFVITMLGCGGAPTEPTTADDLSTDGATPSSDDAASDRGPEPSASAGDDASPDDASAGGGDADAEPAGGSEPPLEELARYLIKRPGRRVAYSPDKKWFAVTRETTSGGLTTLDIVFYDDTGNDRETVRICDQNECDEHLNELAKKKIPELAQRFGAEGYQSVRAIGWPDRNELSVSGLDMKLRLANRRLTGEAPDGKKVTLGTLPAASPVLLALFVSPDGSLVGYYSSKDESGVNKAFGVFKTKR